MPVRATLVLGLLGLDGGRAWACAPVQRAPAKLAPDQSRAAAPVESNVQNCLHGLSGCDVSALSPDEIKQVSQVSMKRNLDSCMEGSTLCDPTRLTPAEATAVQAARYRRNLAKCDTGSPTCEPLLLNAEGLRRRFIRQCWNATTTSAWRVQPRCDPSRLTALQEQGGGDRLAAPQFGPLQRGIAELRSPPPDAQSKPRW